jgi:hypothetical protein
MSIIKNKKLSKKPAKEAKKVGGDDSYIVGKNYFIRGLMYHYTGEIVRITDTVVVLKNASWITDDGSFPEAFNKGIFEGVEPFHKDIEVIITRDTIQDAFLWNFPLPRNRKCNL